MLVVVHGRTNSGILSVDGAFDPDMREALANAAQRYGLPVGLPSVATLQSNQIVWTQLKSPRAIDCRKSPSCRTARCLLSVICDGAIARLDGLSLGASRHAGVATAGPSGASTMMRRFGPRFGARHGCYLATACLETQRSSF